MLDYYKILGIQRNAAPEEIKSRRKAAMAACHPDTHPNDPQAEKDFKLLVTIRNTLEDPEKRRAYDEELHAWEKQELKRRNIVDDLIRTQYGRDHLLRPRHGHNR